MAAGGCDRMGVLMWVGPIKRWPTNFMSNAKERFTMNLVKRDNRATHIASADPSNQVVTRTLGVIAAQIATPLM